MSKNTFFLILGLVIAAAMSGFSGLVGYVIFCVVFWAAGYAYEAVAAFSKGWKSRHENNPPVTRPVLRVVK